MLNLDRRTLLALLVAGTFFMENLDATVITPALAAMALSFGVAPVDLSVGVSAYMLTLGVCIPVSGWMAVRFGPRRIFAWAIAIFTLASLLCGLSNTLGQFVAARVLQGIGGAMMVPVGRLVVLRETPKDQLVKAIAVLTWPALVAPVLGPPIGGLLVEYSDWRWIFWLNLPLGLLAWLAVPKLVPQLDAEPGRAFDWPGFLLMGSAIFSLMLLAEIAIRPDAELAWLGGSLLAGLVLLALAARHLRTSANPVFSLDALAIRTFSVPIWGGSLFRMGVSAVPFLVPLALQLGMGWSPFHSGLMLMAVFIGNIGIKPMTTGLMRRFGFKPILLVNGAMNCLLIAACALIGTGVPVWLLAVLLCLGGMTRSMQFTALNTMAFADIAKPQMTDANTLFSTAFQLAMGLGVALGAVAWRVGEAFSAEIAGSAQEHPVLAFQIAFVLIALVSAVGMLDSFKLAAQAGNHVVRKKAP